MWKKPHYCAICGILTNENWLDTEFKYDLPDIGVTYFCHSCKWELAWKNLTKNEIVKKVMEVRRGSR